MTGPVILVGLRSDNGVRDRNWRCNRARWQQLGWPLYQGRHEEQGPYSMAVASNRAAALAGDWQVALYVGADFLLVDLDQARQAVARAELTGRLVFAHDHLTLLTEAESQAVRSGHSIVSGERRHRNTFSGVLAFTRDLYQAVGGFDERFVGWGGEDIAFWCACTAVGGGYDRIAGDHFHLWHPRPDEQHEHYPENDALMRRYLAARSSAAKVRALIGERQLEAAA